METILLKKLSKYSVKQLQSKLDHCTVEERSVISFILEKRGVASSGFTEPVKSEIPKSLEEILKAKVSKSEKIESVPETCDADDDGDELDVNEDISIEEVSDMIDAIYESKNRVLLTQLAEYISDISNYEELTEDSKLKIKEIFLKVENPAVGKDLPEKSTKLEKPKTVEPSKKEKKGSVKVESTKVQRKAGKYVLPEDALKNIGRKVSFKSAPNCKEGANQEVIGFIKRVFFDKNDNAFYYYIQANGKYYCKNVNSKNLEFNE